MLKYSSAERKTDLLRNFNNEVRFYIDPRGVEYPPISGTPAYTAVTSSDPVPGSYSLSQGNLVYMLPYSDPMTFQILVKPAFAYDVASSQLIMQWYSGAENISLYYSAGADRFIIYETVSGAATASFGPTFTSNSQLQQWHRISVVINGDTVYAYMRNAKTTGALTISTRLNHQLLNIGGDSAGLINYVRIFPGYAATDQDVLDGFAGVKNEEIFFQFPKTAVGCTRCNINTTSDRSVTAFGVERSTGYKAATANLSLNNLSGEFSDDQYATYAPASGSYNGTSAQRYLTSEVGVQTEGKTKQKGDIVSSGLASYWSFDSGSASASYDISGNGYVATITGATPIAGAHGSGLLFDGIGNKIESTYADVSAFTLSAWFKGAPASGNIVRALRAAGLSRFGLTLDASSKPSAVWVDVGVGFISITSPTAIDATNWHHYVLTHSGTVAVFYIDGVEIGRNSSTTLTALYNSTLRMMVDGSGGGGYTAGTLDEVMLFSRALTLAEVTSLYSITSSYYSLTTDPDFDQIFLGSVPTGSFSRSTQNGGLSTVSLSAEDAIAQMAKRIVRKSRSWENYYLSRATYASDSVFHEIAYLATKREFYNYLTNSSFENATIADSWGTTGTFVRDTTQVLQGTYCGKFSGTDKAISQIVLFTDLTAGERFTGTIYVYSASAIAGTIKLYDNHSAGSNGNTSVAWTHSGKGWDRLVVSHTVVSGGTASDRIKLEVNFTGTVANVPVDCAMLKYGADIPWWILNAKSGGAYSASGVSQIDSEQLGNYDWVGIDADDVDYVHPWAWIYQDENVWENMKQVADACGARLMAIDPSGVLRFRSVFGSVAGSSLGSITGFDGIGAGQQNMQANKITVKGCEIIKRPNVECVWQAQAAGLPSDAATESSQFTRVIATTGTIPSTATDGVTEIEAVYGQIIDKTAVE